MYAITRNVQKRPGPTPTAVKRSQKQTVSVGMTQTLKHTGPNQNVELVTPQMEEISTVNQVEFNNVEIKEQCKSFV